MDRTEYRIAIICVILACFFGYMTYYGSRMDEGTDAKVEVETGSLTSTYIVSAYCPCEDCTSPYNDGFFADGSSVSFPAIAAPRSISFGTRISVPGYGVAEVKDRGSKITGNRLDVIFPLHQMAENWGIQELECEVLK